MIENAISRLIDVVNKVPSILIEISEDELTKKPMPYQWSKKEILGHLVDSATNNHQRFVRGQFETIPEIRYDQNKWNEFSFHQEIDSTQLILFWTIYNKQLIEIIKRIPVEHRTREINVGEKIVTLGFIITDYVDHLEYHLKQITDY